jgi:methyl-accepting chemotaxis protein
MAKDLKVKVRLEGDAKGATKAIKATESRFKRLGKTLKTSALAQVAAIAGVAVALRGLVRGLGAAIGAANRQAEAVNALDGALASLGPSAERVSLALQDQAAALQKVTTFGDETIIQAQAMIASFVKDEDAIKAATKATLDLAEAKGFDLVAAADLVSKTLGSSTNALTRYGIEVTGAVGSTERLTSLTENITRVFGGRATKATETFSGKVKQLSNAWGDLAEAVGEAITKNEDASQSIDDLTKSVANASPAVAKFVVSMLHVAGAIAKATFAIFEFQAKIQLFIPNLIRTELASRATAVSMDAMAATAKRLGISVDELKKRMAAGVAANRALGEETEKTAEKMDVATDAIERQIAAQKRLDEKAKQAATAMEELGAALDQVTSAELAAEILEIEDALEKARETTGGFGEEFERLERIAKKEITSIQRRMEGLEDGLGDVAEAFDEVGDAVDDTGDSFDGLSRSVLGTNRALSDQARQAVATGRELTHLTGINEQLALAEARTALAASQEARSNISGVASQRTTYSYGYDNRSSYALSEFGSGGRNNYIVQPDGTLRPR